jgi:hypothetical protein|uniref:Uncharacterized protein n=1 Tax=viral metagenome TaxID=1070528 RepID=A0A6C0IWN1_9ZZZZ
MIAKKRYTITITFDNPFSSEVLTDEFIEKYINKNWVGKCYQGAYIIDLLSIDSRSDIVVRTDDLTPHGEIQVDFIAEVDQIGVGEILPDCEVIHNGDHMVFKSGDHIHAVVIKDKYTKTLGMGDHVPLMVRAVDHTPAENIVCSAVIDVFGIESTTYKLKNIKGINKGAIAYAIENIKMLEEKPIDPSVADWLVIDRQHITEPFDFIDMKAIKKLADGDILTYDPAMGIDRHIVEAKPSGVASRTATSIMSHTFIMMLLNNYKMYLMTAIVLSQKSIEKRNLKQIEKILGNLKETKHKKPKAKKEEISMPAEEWISYKKRLDQGSAIYTVRVFKEYHKYKLGKTYYHPFLGSLKVTKAVEIKDPAKDIPWWSTIPAHFKGPVEKYAKEGAEWLELKRAGEKDSKSIYGGSHKYRKYKNKYLELKKK